MSDEERPVSSADGVPVVSDIERWRDLVDQAQGGSDIELVGIEKGPNGILLGIFR